MDSHGWNYASDANVDLETVVALIRDNYGTVDAMLAAMMSAGASGVAEAQAFSRELAEARCVYHTPGCTLAIAVNYDSRATINDGAASCW